MKIRRKLSFFALHFLALSGCIREYKIDVFTQMPLGSRITKQILIDSDQIFQNKGELILLYNVSRNPEYYDPHLMFFNDSNRLYATCYYPSEKIDSVKGNVIYGILNLERNKRKNRYRCDLPPNYILDLWSYQGMQSRLGNKIITGITLSDTDNTVQFEITEADDRYVLIDKNMNDINLNPISKFKYKSNIVYKISDLLLDYKHGVIQTRELNQKNELVNEILVFKDDNILKDFYEKLWTKLGKN